MRKLRFFAIILFFAAICLPALQMFFRFHTEFEDAEKRELAKPPQWTTTAISKLPGECESYFQDHFGFRPEMIRWNNILRIGAFGVSPAISVVVGKDSWLFYCPEILSDGNSVNDFMGSIPLSDADMEGFREKLEQTARKFAENGIVYILAIAPNKISLYDEYLPDRIRECAGRTRLDQFMEYMAKNSSLKVLDLRGPLREEKKNHPTFWATDTHWNSYGAYVGYREIMKRLSESYPTAKAVPIKGEVSVRERPNGGDLAQILFIHDRSPEKNDTALSLDSNTRPARFRKLLFRHDSFGDGLYPYLQMHFENISSLPPFAPFFFNELLADPPDIVLHIFVERYLPQAIHDDFFYPKGEPWHVGPRF
ncbi:MAG: hypothetical protein LLG06_10620 [Desulfobacteraceae bacterium]|nr:hypothetical protein [Desulfobacteraceae bacterium]